MNKKLFLCLILTLNLACILKADLIWESGRGWRTEGGILELFFGGKDELVVDAIELMNLAKKAQQNGNFRKARSFYKSVYRKYPNSLFAPEAYYETAQTYIKQKRIAKAFEFYKKTISIYANYEKFDLVLSKKFEVAESLKNGARLRLFWGILPGFKSPKKAIEYYEDIIKTAPFSEYAPSALLSIAEISQEINDQEIAISALNRLINNYPKNKLEPKAYIKIARIYKNLVTSPDYDPSSSQKSLEYYEDYRLQFPNGSHVIEAEESIKATKELQSQSRFDMGEYYYLVKRDDKAATILFNQAITIAPESPTAQKAEERIQKIRNKDPRPAAPGSFLIGDFGLPVDPNKDSS